MSRFLVLWFAVSIGSLALRAQEVSDLRFELRSATGSNRFQVGEVIPLELIFSSTVPRRYLEPCLQLYRSCFGYPVCRFSNHWKFTITPEQGWVDLDRPCGTMSGPTVVVPDHDLTPQPTIIPYELTERFRFDIPGKYTVRFSTDVGLDDDSNPRPELFKPIKGPLERRSVGISAQFQFEIIPGDSEWRKEVIRRGYEAYLGKVPQQTNPPSPEWVQYQRATIGLCELGTPEAARVLVGLLLQGHSEVRSCLERSPNTEAAVQEMERLLSDPGAAILPRFFDELLILRNEENRKPTAFFSNLRQQDADNEREHLVAALPDKKGEALSVSLLAVLYHPAASQKSSFEWSTYQLPFSDPVLAMTAANFERFPRESQKWLLTESWDLIRSPLMLPTMRRMAEAGDGLALLRWQELDPHAANAFVRAEVLSPEPRFSSFYLRLPEPLLTAEEEQLAANFVRLAEQYNPHTYNDNFVRASTLLHSYGSRSTLSTVLPVINAHWRTWSCTMSYPVLAYLLKVSPEDAAPKLEEAARGENEGPCSTPTFFSNLGFLEPTPILERLAFSQLADRPGPFARDAISYLRSYAPAGAKALVWERLQYWQRRQARLTETTARQAPAAQEQEIRSIAVALAGAFEGAQGWLLTPEDETRLLALLGDGASKSANLSFTGPARFAIYEGETQPDYQLAPILDYLQPPGLHYYSIKQYKCPNMQALKNKLLQFPAGSSFDFVWNFSGRDRGELVEISNFLWNNGYIVRNPQKWAFLRDDTPN